MDALRFFNERSVNRFSGFFSLYHLHLCSTAMSTPFKEGAIVVKRRPALLVAALVAMLVIATLAMAAFATQKTQCATVGSELTAATATYTHCGDVALFTAIPAVAVMTSAHLDAAAEPALYYAYADGSVWGAKEACLTATCTTPNESTMCAGSYDRAAGAKIDATSSPIYDAVFSTTANYDGATTTIATGYKGIDNPRT